MIRVFASLLLVLFAGQAGAQGCPDFFRFVDFGLEVEEDVFYRGGPTYRAESLGGSPLLLRERTACRAVRDIATDGHGNPIPVVTSVTYDPAKTGVSLSELRLLFVEDALASAEMNAADHRALLDLSDAEVTRGGDFLCVGSGDLAGLSCQVVSPYPGNAPLVAYCDAAQCRLPVLAIDEQIAVAAVWPIEGLLSAEALGAAVVEKVRDIHAFLEPLSAG